MLRLQLVKQLQDIAHKKVQNRLRQNFFTLLTVNYLGHGFGSNAIKPIKSKGAAIHRIISWTTKNELMRLIGTMNVYSKSIE